MRIGIVTRYQRWSGAYAALQLAGVLRRYGQVSFLSPERPTALHPTWDRYVTDATSRGRTFVRWFEQFEPDLVVWTQAPSPSQVIWATKQGAVTILVATCQEKDTTIRDVYRRFGRVVAPSRAAAQLLARGGFGVSSVISCPWATGTSPVSRVTVVSGSPRVLLPVRRIDGGEPARLILRCAQAVLEHSPASLTLVTSGAPVALLGQVKQYARILRQESRLTVVRVGTYPDEVARLGAHDLVISPYRTDPFSMLPLMSLTQGTPVLCWNVPPLDELVIDRISGLFIPPYAGVDEFASFAAALASSPTRLSAMTSAAYTGVEYRRMAFASIWHQLVSNLAQPAPARVFHSQ